MSISFIFRGILQILLICAYPSLILGQLNQNVALELMNTNLSTKSGLTSVPPNCWINAIRVIHPASYEVLVQGNIYASDGTKFCAALRNPDQQLVCLFDCIFIVLTIFK